MPAEIYEIVAQGARYWFLLLMALIVWRSYRWFAKDRRQRKKRLRLLPDAGYVGEMVVLKGSERFPRGTALPVPREGTLGYNRMNDLCVPVRGVSKRHFWFCFSPEEGLTVEPYFGKTVKVDGQERTGRRDPLHMGHGSRLYVGEAELRLRLFAGFAGAAAGAASSLPPTGGPEQAAPQAPALTPAQFAAWQQQLAQQQYAQQLAYAQWMAHWAAQAPASPGGTAASGPHGAFGMPSPMEVPPEAQAYSGMAAPESAAHDDAAEFMGQPPEEAPAPFSGEEQPPAGDFSYAPPGPYSQTEFETPGQFYPPAGDPEDGEAWPYLAFPPEDIASAAPCPEQPGKDWADDDLTDAAMPPKSAYVGHDEAEEAKRRFWDKYLGGGGQP